MREKKSENVKRERVCEREIEKHEKDVEGEGKRERERGNVSS